MEVVSAEVNSLLPEEIMDTGITLVEDDSIEAVIVSSPMGDSIPMETELEEIVNISSTSDASVTTTATVTAEAVSAPSNHSGDVTANTATIKAEGNSIVKPAFQSGLHKLGAQTPVTISANQIILNKTTDLKIGNQSIKPDGQKLIVTTLGKTGQPIVLALPRCQLPQAQKTVSQTQGGDSKVQGQQIKVVIGGRSEVKPVVGVSALTQGSQLINTAAQPSVLQTQQLKTVQVK
uniref:Lin-54-like protein n=1 Tax=Pavo cristatus TaxID=9049 RepID=A0A8C9L7X3_PAVCR